MEEGTGGTHSTTLEARPNVSADTFIPDWDPNSVSRPGDRDSDSDDEQEDEPRSPPAVAVGGKRSKRKGPGLNVPLDVYI